MDYALVTTQDGLVPQRLVAFVALHGDVRRGRGSFAINGLQHDHVDMTGRHLMQLNSVAGLILTATVLGRTLQAFAKKASFVVHLNLLF